MDNNARIMRWLIILLAVIVISIMGITMGGRNRVTFVENTIGNIITPVQKGVYTVGGFFADKIRPVISIWTLESENQRLLLENEKLTSELVDVRLSIDELDDLKSLKTALNYIDDLRIDDYVTCNVIAKDLGNWYNLFTIDVGTNDGVTKNSTVMNGNGLVGLVYEVGSNWSKVITIIDNKSSIGFEVLGAKASYDGILHGSVSSVISGELFDPHAQVEVDNLIVTSGLGIYPKGILIGRISEVKYNIDHLLTEIVVEPSVNFKDINRVFVVVKEDKND